MHDLHDYLVSELSQILRIATNSFIDQYEICTYFNQQSYGRCVCVCVSVSVVPN